jgi:3-dehydroquinate synthase
MIKSEQFAIKLSKSHVLKYEVIFVSNLFSLSKKTFLEELCTSKKILIVVDEKVYKIYGNKIENYFKNINSQYSFHKINAVEASKTMESVLNICELAKNLQLRRDSIFIGIGGGITLDIIGFAAFMFRRKLAYIRIPTTLVGLIDAGIGIKVGVNFKNSKNLLGGYYQPLAVFNDQSFLNTLGRKDIRNGLFEILKMGLIKNKKLFNLIEKHYKNFLDRRFNQDTNQIIYLSALSMMKELEPNLYEHNLKRSVDFGHTFSTYVEESSNYDIYHGEAVGIDMLISARISYKRGVFPKKDFLRVFDLIKSIGFSKKYEFASIKHFHSSLNLVRNHRAGNLNLVLPSKIGSFMFTNKCTLEELSEAVTFYKNVNE